MDPKALLASADILAQIDKLCKRQFSDPHLADECYLYVLDELEAEDYARLREFRGKSAEKTFVHALVARLGIDFKRERFGRKRVPKSVVDLGAWAEEVYKLICWQRHSLREAFEIITLRGLYDRAREAFLREAGPIRSAPCPENLRSNSLDDERNDLAASLSSAGDNPLERMLANLDHEPRLRAAKALRNVMERLSEEDKLLVQFVYGEDQSVAKTARALGVSLSDTRRRLKLLLAFFKTELLRVGVSSLKCPSKD